MSEKPEADPSLHAGTPPARRREGASFFFPLILVVVGIVLLLNTTNILPWFAWWRLWVLWPAFLVMIGLDILLRRAPALLRLLAALVVIAVLVGAAFLLVQPGQELTRPRQTVVERGTIREGDVRIDMGVGQLTIEPLGDTPNWAEVDLAGPAQEPDIAHLNDTARLAVDQGNWTGMWVEESRWAIRLNPQVPTAVRVHVGVGQCNLNLARLHATRLDVDTGVADCTVNLPAGGESGTVQVAIEGGIGVLRVVVPEGVAAQIRVDSGVSGRHVDTRRFPEVGEDLYRSANYDTAVYRLDVKLDLGMGSLEVK